MVKTAIEATMPDRYGFRHRRLFEFGRWLKSHPGITDAPVTKLKPYLRKWHEAAESTIRTKSFCENWYDFAESWGKIKHPKGAGKITHVMERARTATLAATPAENRSLRIAPDEQMSARAYCRSHRRSTG